MTHNTSIQHINSFYAATADAALTFPRLLGDTEADVCIIGGGYTGLTSALYLAERGYKVVVLEAARVGWGASGRNGGHVGVGPRAGQKTLEKTIGKERARALWNLTLEGTQAVRDLVQKHKIDCDFKEGNVHIASKPAHAENYRKQVAHLRKHYDFDQIRYLGKAEVRQMVGTKAIHGGYYNSFACHLHPLKYAQGLARAAAKAGVTIYEQSRVSGFTKGGTPVVSTGQGRVKVKFIILACNGYLEKLEPRMAPKIMPLNNYMLATEPLSEERCRELIRDDHSVTNSKFVVNYWKLSADNRLLFGGGESYTSRHPGNIKALVRKHLLRIYPQLENTRIDYGWGGTLAITMNRMSHLGRLENNVFFSQGYSGHGLPIASLSAKLLAEAVAGTAERFDLLGSYPIPAFPGGTLLRRPGQLAGMLFYTLMDLF